MAERSYARLSRILQHEWREKKPLILYASNSDFVQTNTTSGDIGEGTGGFTDFYRNRMVIPFTGVYDDFEHVLEHEMVHAFQFDIFSRGRAGAGLQSFASINPPLWFMEGMAEYLSLGPVDVATAMWMRDAALHGEMPNLERLTYDPSIFPYRYGHALWAYVGQKWGDDAVGAILQGALGGGVERSFQRVLGISLEQLVDEWVEAVQNNYLPQVPNQQRPRAVARVVANRHLSGGGYHVAPQISPDGRHVVYLSERNFYFIDLYMAEVDNPRNIRKLIGSALNPNFESLRFIYSAGAWSPDSREFVFASKSGGQDVLNIMDVRRGRVTERLRLGFTGINNPSFSPDGQHLVFTGFDGGWSDLYVVDRDGNNLRRLTRDGYADIMPQWSPDGRSIAFTTDRGPDTDFSILRFGRLKIALYWLDGDSIQILPRMDEGRNTNAVWAPDGRSLMFLSTRTGISNVFLYDFDTRDIYQLSRAYTGVAGITNLSPAISWGREADRAAFTFYEGGEYNVYVADNPRALRGEPYRSNPQQAVLYANASALPLRADQALAYLGVRPAAQDAPLVSAVQPAATPSPATLPGPINQPGAPTTVSAPAPAVPAGGQTGQPPSGPPSPEAVASALGGSIYRSGGQLRPSDTRPPAPPPGTAPPISIAALLDSAELALPDTSEFTIRRYQPKYAADLVSRPTIGYSRDNFGRGFFGGAAVQFTDLLGDHAITLSGAINGRIREAQIYAAYTNLTRRMNWAVGIAQDVQYYYLQGTYTSTPGGPDVLNQPLQLWTARQVFTQAYYPLSRFKRIEGRFFVVNLEQATLNQITLVDPITLTPYAGFDSLSVNDSRLYVMPSIALVYDNSLFGWTSPFLGQRYRFEITQAVGGYSFTRFLADWRRYTPIVGPFTLATRITSIGATGKDENLFPIYVGTPDRVRGYTYNSLLDHECRSALLGQSQGCPQLNQLIGSRMAVAGAELRFPLLRSLALGFAPIGLPPIEMAVFYDAGLAWQRGSTIQLHRDPTDPSNIRAPVSSWGFGFRINVLGFMIMSIDYAKPLTRAAYNHGYWIVSLYPPW
jgi:Tol biopolymer transport system component